jgi:cbb3-type cytochrome oxidase subunit 3|tara:strand:- start:728 stop:844 length:117 start_codon:yes stop_codon:yes gene_type:complete
MAFFADFWVLILFGLLLIPVAIHRQGEKRRERFEDRDN